MPKKFKGENSKAVEARARKAAVQHAEKERKVCEAEDEYWRDDDKHNTRKLQRKDDKEKKRVDQLERKKELQKLHDEELDKIKSAKPEPVKVTRHQIDVTREKRAQEEAVLKVEEDQMKRNISSTDLPLENINRMDVEGLEARTVEDAITALSVKDQGIQEDMHPEKRMKAAFAAFEEVNLPRLKAENPNLRLSQLKQMLRKDWMKSPENPLNQTLQAYNAKKT